MVGIEALPLGRHQIHERARRWGGRSSIIQRFSG